jgi:hypothetical protein
MPGFSMGPAQKTNKIQAIIGQNEDMVCNSFALDGTKMDVIAVASQSFNILATTCVTGQGNSVTINGLPPMNSLLSDMVVTLVTDQPIPVMGTLVLRLPKLNSDYTGLGLIIPQSFIQTASLTATGTFSNNLAGYGLTAGLTDIGAILCSFV